MSQTPTKLRLTDPALEYQLNMFQLALYLASPDVKKIKLIDN
jgi:hypothetical protein